MSAVKLQSMNTNVCMLVNGKELSEAEFNTLMKQHKANVQDLENNFETEKERQRKALEKKVR